MSKLRTSERERQAHAELGRTQVLRTHAWVLVAGFLATIAAGALTAFRPAEARRAAADLAIASFDAVRAAAARPAPRTVQRANHRLLAVIDDVEARIEDVSPWRLATLRPTQLLLSSWGGVGNQRVVLGNATDGADGTHGRRLAFRPGVDYMIGPPFLDPAVLARRRAATASWLPVIAPDPRPALIDFHRQLAVRGVRLMLLPVPTKVMVDPAAAGVAPKARARLDPAELHNPSFARFAADLEAAGIPVLDPSGALTALQSTGIDAYLRTDSHWSPAGVDAVARALARQLERLGIDLGPRRAWQRQSTEVTAWGDLARMLVAADDAPFMAVETITVERVRDAAGIAWAGDREAAVLLLGDSFTNVFASEALGWGTGAGLAEQLAFHLGRAVDRLAVDGGGAAEARERLAASLTREPRVAATRIVVLQIAVRELAAGDWRPVALPVDTVPPRPPPATAGPVAVRATVAAAAPAPRPDATPYREALVAVHLIDVEPLEPTLVGGPPRRVLAYAWGLRDGRAAGGAELRAGQRIEGRLVPWSTVMADMESVQRVELDDLGLLTLEAYWMEVP